MQSSQERFKNGKALRVQVPREQHSKLNGFKGRDPVAILAESDPSRVQSLLPVRYARMLQSPFTFLRGAAAVMAADLANAPMVGIPVQACGDCHLMNFGAFATPEDNILFDINDFDETLPGVDFTVDLKRLAASVAVAALAANLSEKRARALSEATVTAYRERIFATYALSPLQVWHSRIDLEQQITTITDKNLRRKLGTIIRKARGGGLEQDDNFPHLVAGDKPRIADSPPLIYHLQNDDSGQDLDVASVFAAYRETLAPDRRYVVDGYNLVDLAFKVVGVGSVGTFCAIGLFMSGDKAPLFLQIKEAQHSVLERIDPHLRRQGHQGQRVVEGQRALQAASDIFLGWTQDQASGRHFYIRQLKNRRLGSIGELVEAEALADYAALCGRTLARAHARTGDAAMIAGYMGKGRSFDDAIAEFSMAYAEQTRLDHAALVVARSAVAEKGTATKPKVAPSVRSAMKARA
ncbi:DUF2252 domain-containing protein [Bosea sp. OK403]|uniref:DUF2252 domain-containing protein n=1 Tax=Bosea sp. OK403 TaxID=1855286 RepID=UPI001FCDFAA0|nr:DUF2252 domain-containing protein [Bosea sp. OK403]